ncbi:DUF58 domain-containing protein [Nibricoccus aquaticus]|uniref:DUF58 domain-containing protein n=1 Tax=Nibricoccus aquaticus TaxID=2576891 RepID=UPI0010FE72F2|nr:DUF58 domain-containing protein [Nibricoccus aquaticus]
MYPQRGQRVRMTLPGAVLVALSLGVGLAAYNSANNILFITLSLLLACLVLSGVLSWLNLSGVRWRLVAEPPMRAGQAHPVVLELLNAKRVLPTYGVWFELKSTSLAKAERLDLRERLDAGGEARLDWTVRPARRGKEVLSLEAVGSLFPFGFLRKTFPVRLTRELIVWPAAVEYRRFPAALWERAQPGRALARAGGGAELHSLRRYAQGDSHRAIHWKATARLGRLMVTRRAADGEDGYSLWLRTPAEVWTRAEQFELLCGLAATLAEDLFRAGRLLLVAINDEAPMAVRRVADLEAFLDAVALVGPLSENGGARSDSAGVKMEMKLKRKNVLIFAPEGARGVAAYVDGEKAASA